MRVRFCLAATTGIALALMMAGCGSVGGGVISVPGPGMGTGPSSGGSPAPTPAPTPTPTPTPTPAPASFPDIASSPSYEGRGVSALNATYAGAGTPPSRAEIVPYGATISYDAATRTYRVTPSEQGLPTQTFGAADIDPIRTNAAFAVYSRTTAISREVLTVTNPGTSGHFTYQYVGSALSQKSTVTGAGGLDVSSIPMIFGIETYSYANGVARSAVPGIGKASYDIDVLGVGTANGGAVEISGSGYMDIDLASNVFSIHAVTTGLASSTVFTADGGINRRYNSPNAYLFGQARLTGSADLTGQIRGAFYGPTGVEVGLTWEAAGADGTSNPAAVGTVTGRRTQDLMPAAKIDDPSSRRQFYGGGTIGAFPSGSSQPLQIHYDPENAQYSVIINRSDSTFSSETYSANGPDVFSPSGRLGLTLHRGATQPLDYVRSGEIVIPVKNNPDFPDSRNYQTTAFTFGLPTPDTALPRSGNATYKLDVFGTMNFYEVPQGGGNPIVFFDGLSGTANLKADLVGGRYTLAGGASVNRGGAVVDKGTLFGTGAIAAGFNSTSVLMGQVALEFNKTGAFSGNFSGGFFGPTGEEIGGGFEAKGAPHYTVTATAIGKRTQYDPNPVIPPVDDVAYLSTGYSAYLHSPPLGMPTNDLAVSTGLSGVSSPSASYAPLTSQFTVTPSSSNGDIDAQVSFGAAQRDAAASDANFDVYRVVQNGSEYTARVLKVGNKQIAMTYAGFVGLGSHIGGKDAASLADDHDNYAFALLNYRNVSPTVPTAGTAAYAGVLFGNGVQLTENASKTLFDLTGTSHFAMDFATASFTGRLTIDGRNTANGSTTAFGTYAYTGPIAGSGFDATGFGGALHGSFFGPEAQEVAGVFTTDQVGPGTRTALEGVFLAK